MSASRSKSEPDSAGVFVAGDGVVVLGAGGVGGAVVLAGWAVVVTGVEAAVPWRIPVEVSLEVFA
jgi:hypothetical protein